MHSLEYQKNVNRYLAQRYLIVWLKTIYFTAHFFEKKTILIVPVFLASQKLMLFIQNYAGVMFVPMFVPFNIKKY